MMVAILLTPETRVKATHTHTHKMNANLFAITAGSESFGGVEDIITAMVFGLSTGISSYVASTHTLSANIVLLAIVLLMAATTAKRAALEAFSETNRIVRVEPRGLTSDEKLQLVQRLLQQPHLTWDDLRGQANVHLESPPAAVTVFSVGQLAILWSMTVMIRTLLWALSYMSVTWFVGYLETTNYSQAQIFQPFCLIVLCFTLLAFHHKY
jgi:hypothetical protein